MSNKTIIDAKNMGYISTKDISDGHHTFGELYSHRIALFCVICNSYPELSWKSKKHFNEEEDQCIMIASLLGLIHH